MKVKKGYPVLHEDSTIEFYYDYSDIVSTLEKIKAYENEGYKKKFHFIPSKECVDNGETMCNTTLIKRIKKRIKV